jgi:uncharacterized glyoxalase superfamily protein PhnB
MMSIVKPIPDGMNSITPHLVCAGASEAIEFYKNAFNAEEMFRLVGPEGKLIHACISIGNSKVMLVDEFPEWGSLGPKALNGSPVTIHLYVEDADSMFAQAVKAGATVKMPLENMFWGDRYGIIIDPFGHCWSIATHVKDVSYDELQSYAGKGCPEL